MERLSLSSLKQKVENELFVSSVVPDASFPSLVGTLTSSHVAKKARFQAGLNLAAKPFKLVGIDIKKAISNRFYNSTNAPFNNTACELYSYGGESLVFLSKVNGKNKHVIKMDKQSIGLPRVEQIKRAMQLKQNHNQLTAWFQDVKDFVVPSDFFIGRLPFKNQIAVGTIQPYIKGVRGLFEDFSANQLSVLFSQYPSLRKDFINVVNKISNSLSETGRNIDLVGSKNLSIANGDASPKLVLIDSCDVKDPFKTGISQRFIDAQGMRMDKLKELGERARVFKKFKSLNPAVITYGQ